MKDIEYFRKDNYGTTMFYIKEAKTKSIIEKLTGHKTLTNNTMTCLIALGFTFKEVLP